MTRARFIWNIIDTLLILATGFTVIIWVTSEFQPNFWVSFSIGFMGSGLMGSMLNFTWRRR